MVLDHDRKIDSLMSWRSELRGAMALVKITLGASIVSGLVSIITIFALLSGQTK